MTVAISDLVKSYACQDHGPVRVLDIPHFALGAGEQVALTGGSGSGKTTLLHLIAGILLPDQGRIVFADGVDLVRLPEAQRDVYRGRNIGYVFQRHHLLPGFTALENVLLGMGFSGRRPDPAWARHLLEQVGLGERLHHRPRQLSVGQQQRVACARALANRPPLVLADEPTGALDEANANQVLELIVGLCRELKASLLIATHDARVVAALPRTVALAGLNRQPA